MPLTCIPFFFGKFCHALHLHANIACVAGRRKGGRKVKISAGGSRSSRVRSSRASFARLSPFPLLLTPTTKAIHACSSSAKTSTQSTWCVVTLTAKELGTRTKNDIKGITFGVRPVWKVHSFTFHLVFATLGLPQQCKLKWSDTAWHCLYPCRLERKKLLS